jgi:NAD(P)-dependent dehydrogenase (short-subunit alcohol dehydrogenase family)
MCRCRQAGFRSAGDRLEGTGSAVTGASSGIGTAIAERLTAGGCLRAADRLGIAAKSASTFAVYRISWHKLGIYSQAQARFCRS